MCQYSNPAKLFWAGCRCLAILSDSLQQGRLRGPIGICYLQAEQDMRLVRAANLIHNSHYSPHPLDISVLGLDRAVGRIDGQSP